MWRGRVAILTCQDVWRHAGGSDVGSAVWVWWVWTSARQATGVRFPVVGTVGASPAVDYVLRRPAQWGSKPVLGAPWALGLRCGSELCIAARGAVLTALESATGANPPSWERWELVVFGIVVVGMWGRPIPSGPDVVKPGRARRADDLLWKSGVIRLAGDPGRTQVCLDEHGAPGVARVDVNLPGHP